VDFSTVTEEGVSSFSSRLHEVNKPRCTSVRVSLARILSPTCKPWAPCATVLRCALHYADEGSFWSDSGDDGVEGFTDAMAHGYGGHALGHFALDFAGGVAFAVQLWRWRLVRCRSRGGFSIEQSLDQPLRDHVGEASVGRGGVGIILHGEAEVALSGSPGRSSTYSPGPMSLMTRARGRRSVWSAALRCTRNR